MKRTIIPGRRRFAVGAVVVTALTAAACGNSAAGAPKKDGGGATVKVGIVTKVGVDGILGWAQQEGILARDLAPAGIGKVEFSTFATGPTLNAALTSGSVDVASQGDTPAITLKANGFDSRAIAISGINTNYSLVASKGGPTTLTGLIGKKVSAAPGTAPEQYLIELLAQEHLTGKIAISHLQTNDAAAAVRAGSIDAFVASGPMAATFAQQGYPVVDEASKHTGLYTTSVNVASSKFLNAHPKFAAAWGSVITDSVADLRKHPDAYWAFAAKAEKVSVPIAKAANPLNSYPDGPFSATGVQQLEASYRFLLSHKLIKNQVDIDGWLARS
jgi:NitT/TauT family transport system substrate-binding protein/sulfonate transport system substrate-binding protein